MKKRNVRFTMIPLFLAMLLIGQVSLAQPDRQGRGNGGKEGYRSSYHENNRIPDLSEDQNEQIQKLNLEFDKKTLDTSNQIKEKEAQLRSLVTQDKVNQGQVNKLVDEIGALQITIRKERIQTELKIRDTLTEDQKISFNKYWANRSGYHKGYGRTRE